MSSRIKQVKCVVAFTEDNHVLQPKVLQITDFTYKLRVSPHIEASSVYFKRLKQTLAMSDWVFCGPPM